MFGHDNTNSAKNGGGQDQDINKLIEDLNNSQPTDSGTSMPPVTAPVVAPSSTVPQPAVDSLSSLGNPSVPTSQSATPAQEPTPVTAPVVATPAPAAPAPINLPDEVQDKPVDLVELKTKALDELYPIIHKLDLSAEENFKTLMMMIQASDNKDLIAQAYEAAEKIEDESVRAKALLDIVNEINYFTHQPSTE